MTLPIKLRDATIDDHKVLAPLFQEVADFHAKLLNFAPDMSAPANLALTEKGLKAKLSRPHSKLMIAEDNGNATGVIFADRAEKIATIRTVDVAEKSRGKGIGPMLISAIEDWADDNGAESVQLRVFNANAAALHTYQKSGYTPKIHFAGEDNFISDQESTVLVKTLPKNAL